VTSVFVHSGEPFKHFHRTRRFGVVSTTRKSCLKKVRIPPSAASPVAWESHHALLPSIVVSVL